VLRPIDTIMVCEANDTLTIRSALDAHALVTQTRARLMTLGGRRGDPLMDDPELDARLAASRARSLGKIRRARETILNLISQNERLARREDFEVMARRRIEEEHRELEELDQQEAMLEAELRRGDTA
jgi:hypothetical protein